MQYREITPPGEDWLAASELCEVAFAALKTKEQHLAVRLFYFDGLKQSTVAGWMGVILERPYTESRVNTILQTSTRRMRRAITEERLGSRGEGMVA